MTLFVSLQIIRDLQNLYLKHSDLEFHSLLNNNSSKNSLNLLLISSWMQFWFVTVIPKFSHF
jgi:hypothetical protein